MTKHDKKLASAQSAAEAWNAKHPPGTAVLYHPVAPWPDAAFPPERTRTRSTAWATPSASALVKVMGRAGGVSLSHLELVHEDGDDVHARRRRFFGDKPLPLDTPLAAEPAAPVREAKAAPPGKRVLAVEVSEDELAALALLGRSRAGAAEASASAEAQAAAALGCLVHHAVDGVCRPGSWERHWLVSAFADDWVDELESDPAARWRVRVPVATAERGGKRRAPGREG